MKRIVASVVVAAELTGCASTTHVAQHPATPSAAQVAVAKQVVSRDLKDPDSAQFRDIFAFHYDGQEQLLMVCGQLNAKNSYGGYSGFSYFFTKLSAQNEALLTVVDGPDGTNAKYVCTGSI